MQSPQKELTTYEPIMASVRRVEGFTLIKLAITGSILKSSGGIYVTRETCSKIRHGNQISVQSGAYETFLACLANFFHVIKKSEILRLTSTQLYASKQILLMSKEWKTKIFLLSSLADLAVNHVVDH